MNTSFYIATSMQIKARGILSCLVAIFLFASCQSYKKVPYLQDSEVVGQAVQQETLYDARIMPKDQLTVVVSCTNPELAAPFNLDRGRFCRYDCRKLTGCFPILPTDLSGG